MTDSEIIEQIKTDLGWPVIEVYTPDKSIQSFIRKGYEMLAANVYRKVALAVPAIPYQKLDREQVRFVIECTPYEITQASDSVDVYLRDEFSLTTAIQYFNMYANNSIIIPTVASTLYNQINYSYNMAFDWKYDDTTGELFATHIPSNTSFLAVKAKTIYTRETLDPEHESWLLNFAEGQTKITEGRIRSKYKEGSVGATSDGDALISEGQADVQGCMEALAAFVPMDVGRRA